MFLKYLERLYRPTSALPEYDSSGILDPFFQILLVRLLKAVGMREPSRLPLLVDLFTQVAVLLIQAMPSTYQDV